MTGTTTLIDTIREQADRDIAALWDKARADADACRAAAARSVDDRRAAAAEALRRSASAAAAAATAQADAAARHLRADAKAGLAARMHAMAVAALPRLRERHYPELFAALARELPPRQWQRIVVNPADRALAAAEVPGADIACDPGVIGGFVVDGDGLRISNTLEARLAAAWPDLLAAAIDDVLQETAG